MVINTAIGLLLAAGCLWAYGYVIYRLRRLFGVWTGRDVMSQFRPHRLDVVATERALGVAATPVSPYGVVVAMIRERQ